MPRMYQRRSTVQEWADENPILGAGELGVEFAENGDVKLKVGTGNTPWNQLDYLLTEGGGGGGISDGTYGDVEVSGGGTVWTVVSNAISYDQFQDVSATDKVLGRFSSGAGDVEEIACTGAGRALLDDADAAAQRTTLGLGNVDNTSDLGKPISTATQTALDGKQPLDSDLTTIAGLTATTNNIVQSVSSAWASRTPTQVTATLDNVTSGAKGLAPASGGGTTNFLRADATWAAPPDNNTLGPDGDKGDITVGGTGTTLTIDNDAVTYAKIQNVTATDKLLGRVTAGAGDVEEITCTAAGRALLDDADAAAQRTTLSLNNVTNNAQYFPGGTDVALADGGTGASLSDPNADRIMFWDDSAGAVTWLTAGTNLTITGTTIDAAGGGGGSLTVKEDDVAVDTTVNVIDFGNGFDVAETPEDEVQISLDLGEYTGSDLPVASGGTGGSDAATARTNLGLVIGTNVQAWDADLDQIASLSATTDNMIQSVGSAWSSRTPAQVRAALGLNRSVRNASVSTPAAGFAADTYLVGSSIAIPASSLQAKSIYRVRFQVSKTAAGVATPILNVRFGTNGSTADTSRSGNLTFPAQTAAIDNGWFEVEVIFRTVGSGTSAVIETTARLTHALSVTGLSSTTLGVSPTVSTVSAGFDSTVVSSIIGLSVNGGASAAWTIPHVTAELVNLL